ncbi:MAG: hypothetical protein PVJ55_01210, partial [Anaerolineae bacterium]
MPMPIAEERMEHVRRVKARYEVKLMGKANVVGVGIGLRTGRGSRQEEWMIIVSVTHKVPRSELDAEDVVPAELDGVPVDIQELGGLRPHEPAQAERTSPATTGGNGQRQGYADDPGQLEA